MSGVLLEHYNLALPISRSVGSRSLEARLLIGIGAVYDALGETQAALEYYNLALPIIRSVGDRSGEAIALNNIASAYHALNQKSKALYYYNNSPDIF